MWPNTNSIDCHTLRPRFLWTILGSPQLLDELVTTSVFSVSVAAKLVVLTSVSDWQSSIYIAEAGATCLLILLLGYLALLRYFEYGEFLVALAHLILNQP